MAGVVEEAAVGRRGFIPALSARVVVLFEAEPRFWDLAHRCEFY